MSGITDVIEAIGDMARAVADGADIADVLHDVAEHAAEALGIEGGGVSLVTDGRLETIASSGERVATLERLQEEHQQGPCIDAAQTCDVVAVDDLTQDADRWPRYANRAAAMGVTAAAGIPMVRSGTCIGVLDLYAETPHRWTVDELRYAQLFADVATGYVATSSELDRLRTVTEQLQRALDSRVVIEQAKGVIAARRRVTVDDAFRILRKHANDHNVDLHSTAHAVVNLGLIP
jgi:GAF domain-containing protein